MVLPAPVPAPVTIPDFVLAEVPLLDVVAVVMVVLCVDCAETTIVMRIRTRGTEIKRFTPAEYT